MTDDTDSNTFTLYVLGREELISGEVMDMVAQDDLWASVGGAKAANTLVVVSGTPADFFIITNQGEGSSLSPRKQLKF